MSKCLLISWLQSPSTVIFESKKIKSAIVSIVSHYCGKKGFPEGSDGKESACNAGDLGSIPGSGRSPGEGTGYPLQYSWASLMVQLVKNLPAMRETWV